MKKIDICPVAKCSEIVHAPKLMCDAHWRKLPVPTRREIFEVWCNGSAKELKLMVNRIAGAMS